MKATVTLIHYDQTRQMVLNRIIAGDLAVADAASLLWLWSVFRRRYRKPV